MQACPNDRINTSYNCGQAWIALFDKRMKEFSVFDIIGPHATDVNCLVRGELITTF